jgi:hypothetical protein
VDKISAALLDFSEPLVAALSEHASQQARREAIGLGVTLWNALVALRLGEPAAFQATLARCRSLPEPQGSVMATLVGQLVERKMERHADDVRLVRDWRLTFGSDGKASLWAEAIVSRP